MWLNSVPAASATPLHCINIINIIFNSVIWKLLWRQNVCINLSTVVLGACGHNWGGYNLMPFLCTDQLVKAFCQFQGTIRSIMLH